MTGETEMDPEVSQTQSGPLVPAGSLVRQRVTQ